MSDKNSSTEARTNNLDAIIKMENLNKWYGTFHVLKDINLNVTKGERIVVCDSTPAGIANEYDLQPGNPTN